MTIKLWNDLDNSNTVNAGDTVAATAVTARRGAGQGRLLRVHRAEGRGVRGAGGLRRRLDPDEADHG